MPRSLLATGAIAAGVALVVAAALVPTAQARFSTGGSGQASQVQPAPVPVIDVAAIQARRDQVGFHRTGHAGVALPSGFTRHKGSVGPVAHNPAQIPATSVKQTGGPGFNWTPVAVGSALVGTLTVLFLLAGGIVRSRRRLATS